MAFVKAVKTESKIRMALAGPSGSGKTYTALTLAAALADGGKVAVIDTERGSASKYADIFPEFDVMELDSYHPDKFVQGIHEAEQAGYSVLVIDSLTHAWNGPGGMLEIVDAIAKRSKSGNTYMAWGEATPIQNRLIDGITRAKIHIIATMRSKTEYILEKDDRTGKTSPRKVGMAPQQRDNFEYEFDIFGEMDYENSLIIQKTRCSVLAGQVIPKPDGKVADIIKTWLHGAPAPVTPAPAPVASPSPVPA
jgi:energy-coupling factor transporter ATP-binding protein EcfA2